MGIKKKEEEDVCGGKPVGEDGKVDYRCVHVSCQRTIFACELWQQLLSHIVPLVL